MAGEQAMLAALDDQYQSKVLLEIQRYEELVREKDALNTRWDEQTQELIASHERLLQEVSDDFTAKLQVFHSASLRTPLGSNNLIRKCLP